jgi:hypothetical protein
MLLVEFELSCTVSGTKLGRWNCLPTCMPLQNSGKVAQVISVLEKLLFVVRKRPKGRQLGASSRTSRRRWKYSANNDLCGVLSRILCTTLKLAESGLWSRIGEPDYAASGTPRPQSCLP